MANLNLGSVSFADDPYQVKSSKALLQQAGLWNPAWDTWANYQAESGDGGGAPMETPDFSSLAGYGAGYGDYGGGNRYEAVTKDGQEVAGNAYNYDEPALFQGQDLLKAAAIVGGGAYGMNSLFGGLGGAAGAAADPMAAYMTTGAVEGSTVGGAAAGGGGAGAVGAGSLASTLASPMEMGLLATGGAPAAAAVAPGVAPAAGSAAGAGLLDKLPALLGNPQVIGAIAGGLLGGTGGGSDGGAAPYTGSMPTITRGDWQPKAQATQMQVPQYGGGLLSGPGVANSGLWRFKK